MAGSYPTSVGLPIPPDTLEARFEPFLSALASMKGAFCRCYKSGSWVPSASCNQQRDSRTSEADIFDHCTFDEPRSDPLSLFWVIMSSIVEKICTLNFMGSEL
eukprot:gnl/MRDRNA2_/MRDRNA2_201984_c0_seq1.p1 gnl/MRDRNA2_/MRDRNA2_201984_c0~~gnl/MRDRNA2_/MRDRNA2_201984_c0_seq1.p1  ORF type:complete len:116 (+),score=10.62 gnl/MRDRNA2_/MRDRNA2_201984_c0_seq1:42-350(+)